MHTLSSHAKPYNNKIWDSTWDKTLKIKTRAIMCSPLFNRDGRVIGAITVINKMDGGLVSPSGFTKADEHRLQAINSHIGVAVEEALLDSKASSDGGGKVRRARIIHVEFLIWLSHVYT
jgi:GAF domain-containing protein